MSNWKDKIVKALVAVYFAISVMSAGHYLAINHTKSKQNDFLTLIVFFCSPVYVSYVFFKGDNDEKSNN